MPKFLNIAFFVFLAAPAARANFVEEHKIITDIAIDTYERCTGRIVPELLKEVLVNADIDEDLNVVRKWVLYSHYYNPLKSIKTWRSTSDVRVIALQSDIENGVRDDAFIQNSYERLGHIIHHLQDMSVPAHVVPVKHWLNDQYEAYYKNHETDSAIPLNCGFVFEPTTSTPIDILKNTAEATLAHLTEKWNVFFEDKPASISWNLFWQSASGDEFGSYGAFGNNFGNPKVTLNGVSFDVPADAYKRFHETQTELAVRSSVQALLWFDTLLK